MDIKSFGCSFVYGSELADQLDSTPSRSTWPALVAQHLDVVYQCYARPGSGNLQIAETVLNQADTPAFYIVGWTWIDRFDYTDSETDQWRTIMPVDTDHAAHHYYRNLHSQYRDKLTTLMDIRLVIDTLKQKGYPFIMTYMDNLIFETEWHCTPAVAELQNYIRPHMTTFNGQTFLEWSRQNKFPETALWHPLEPAHTAASNYILELGVYKK